MPADFFLDTNIFVYSLDWSDQRKTRIALDLIDKALADQRGAVSYQVVQEFYNVALRRLPKPLTINEAHDYFERVFRRLLAVHSSAQLYTEALDACSEFKISWYDSIIVASAISIGCATLYTEDLQHTSRYRQLRVVNPFV